MVNNKKIYTKILLLIIAVLVLSSTQTLAASVAKVTGLKQQSVGNTEAKITWSSLSNVTGYEVYIKPANGTYISLGTLKSNSARITNLSEGTTYYVKVRAYKTTNGTTTNGSFSSEIKITTTGTNTDTSTTVNKATNLKLSTVTETTAKLTWTKSSNATGYEVQIKEANGSYEVIGSTNNTNVTITGLEEGTTYYVRIRAYKTTDGTTTYAKEYSNVLKFTTTGTNNDSNVTLGKVTNLKVKSVTETTATLTWSKVTNATGYEIQIKEANGSYEVIGTTNNTNVTINRLEEGTTYYVRIRAYRTVNGTTTYATSYSDQVKFITDSEEDTTTPDKVTGLTSSNLTESTAKLSWNKVSGVDGYEVYLRKSGTSYSSEGTTSNTYVTLKNLESNTTYYAKIRAYKEVNGKTIYGSFSTEVSFTTSKKVVTPDPVIELDQVLNLNVTPTTTTASLTWDAVSNVDGYEVYFNNQGQGYKSLGTTSKTKVSVIGLVAGKTYNVKVRAYKVVDGKTVYGAFSDEVTFTTQEEETLGTVTNLNVTLGTNQAKLTWNSVSTATGYEVYIKLPGQGYKSLGTVANVNNVRIVNLAKDSSYSVKVRAYKIVNNTTIYGDFSNEVTFTAE